jgi:hypothetical protein
MMALAVCGLWVMWAAEVDVARIGVEGCETRPSHPARRMGGVGATCPGPTGIETSESSRVKRQLRLAVFDFIRPIGWPARPSLFVRGPVSRLAWGPCKEPASGVCVQQMRIATRSVPVTHTRFGLGRWTRRLPLTARHDPRNCDERRARARNVAC